MVAHPPADLVLSPLDGVSRPLEEWLTTFHLAAVVLDPYTNESSWVLPTAVRVLNAFRGADARVSFVVTATPDDARAFLGPLTSEFLVFADPDRTFAKAVELAELPAFLFLRIDGTIQASAEGWDPREWRAVAEQIAAATSWITPAIPASGDPGPFAGTPALG